MSSFMNAALLREVDLDLRLPPHTDVGVWTTRGLRKSGREYDEVECQLAIAGFLAEHKERDDVAD